MLTRITAPLRTPGLQRSLTLGFLAVILAFTLTIPVTLFALARVDDAAQSATASAITLENVAVFQQQLSDVRTAARDLAGGGDPDARTNLTSSLQEALDAARCIGEPQTCASGTLRPGKVLPPGEARQWRAIAEEAANVRTRFDATVGSSPAVAVRELDAAYADRVHAPSQQLAQKITERGIEAQAAIRRATLQAGASILLSVVLCALLATSLAMAIPKRLMGRIEHLRHVAHRLAHGDLTARADGALATRDDEIGDLITDFNIMAMAMEQQTGELRVAQQQLHVALQHEHDRATRDPLTGLRNHRFFQETLTAEIDRAQRSGASFSIAVIDLDDFKQVNDRYGHAEGDAVLRRAAQQITASLRTYDLACRLGGEEFGIILPDTAPHVAHAVLERIAANLLPCGPNGERLTFSGGIACWPTHAKEQVQLYQRADEAAYASKSVGKACTIIYDPAIVASMDSDERTQQRARDAMIMSAATLARTVDRKDPLTIDHSELVALFAVSIARAMQLPEEHTRLVHRAGLLHDIGKVGIPDEVLMKPGPLTEEEWVQMRMHPEFSYRILESAKLEPIATWTRHHHEHFDGTGYPMGLRGVQIPLESRIILVADAFETMTSRRTYRPALSVEQALEELRVGAGTQFDPNIATMMVELVQSGMFDDVMRSHGRLPAVPPVDAEQGEQQLQPGDAGRIAALDANPPFGTARRAA